MNPTVRNARSNSGVRLTSTMRAPLSAAVCLICAKLCVADELMPVTSRKSKIRKRQSGSLASSDLDVLIQPVGRAEEQIALQRHALDLTAVFGQERQLLRAAIERRAVFRAVEGELDRIYAARAQRKGGAADHHADQDAGDESPIDDQQGDGEQRQIFDRQQLPRRLDQPLIDEAGAEKEQEPAEDVFRHIAEESRIGDQHGR